MQRDPESSGPVGQVGNWVFIAFFLYFPRVEMSLRSPGKEKCLVDQLSPFGTSCSLSFKSLLSVITLTTVRDKDNKVYSVNAFC
jgi:hypothetical protein